MKRAVLAGKGGEGRGDAESDKGGGEEVEPVDARGGGVVSDSGRSCIGTRERRKSRKGLMSKKR
jgi:hypothetical protein